MMSRDEVKGQLAELVKICGWSTNEHHWEESDNIAAKLLAAYDEMAAQIAELKATLDSWMIDYD